MFRLKGDSMCVMCATTKSKRYDDDDDDADRVIQILKNVSICL